MTPEEFHKTDMTGRKVVFRNPQIRHGWIESIFKDGAIICRVAYRGKDTKKPVPDDAEIERSYQPCQTFELEEGE